jgi:hypothetical protein
MDKEELISALEDSREDILEALEGISDEQYLAESSFGDWTLKDLLAHLVMWEAETIKLLFQAHQGMTPTTVHLKNIPDDEQNKIWHSQTKDRPLERILSDFYAIRGQTLLRLDEFSNRELNDPARFAWLRGQTLSQLVVDYVLDHEREHAKMIREWRSRQSG